MSQRLCDGEGDWTFGKGLSNYATGQREIQESLRTRLLSWVGDCFFALKEGVDWRNRLDVRQDEALAEEIKAVMMRTAGVTGVSNVTVTRGSADRLFTLTADVETIYSTSFQFKLNQFAGEAA